MNLIKNLHLLEGMPADDLDKMEHAALQHKRYSNITFKVLEADEKKIVMQVSQGKSAAKNYQDGKRLAEIVHETFKRFFQGKKIQVRPYVYVESPADKVTDGWIRNKMTETGVTLKEIVTETGLDKTQLSALINGARPLSQPMKVVFWLYFERHALMQIK